MIGTYIIAIVGYASAAFAGGLSFLNVWIGATSSTPGVKRKAKEAWLPSATASIVLAVITRWLTGGAL